MMDLLMVGCGLIALVGGGDALIRGAVALSLRLGVPTLIVGLTVVAFGTSAPELVVGVDAALTHADGIVFGNVVGSNIANVLLVLGAPALLAPIGPAQSACAKHWALMMAVSLVFVALCVTGPLDWIGGVILLSMLALALADNLREARAGRAQAPDEVADADPNAPWGRIVLSLAIGLIALPLGAHLLVEGAQGFAMRMGLSEAAVGLTLVAIGTSLPELFATLAAARRGDADVAIGGVIGSNLFNLASIMGVVGLLGPLHAPREFICLDFWVMLAVSALLWLVVGRRMRIGRRAGLGMLALYAAYVVVVLGPRM